MPGGAAPGAAEPGSEWPRPRLARSRCGGRSPAQPPPPPAAGSSSPPTSLVLPPARPPAQSAAPGPGEPGRLSGRRRQSATLASRGARRPGTSAAPGTRSAPAAASSPLSRGRSGPRRPGRDSPPLPPGKSSARSGRERAEAPCPRRGAGGGGGSASLPGELHPRRGRGCQWPKRSGGGGGRRWGSGLPGHGEESRTRGRPELGPVSLDLRVGT